MRVGIKDVAQIANVSAATVSYVLSGNKPISEDTRKRVLQAVEQLGYSPNRSARALKSERFGTIGLLVARLTEPATPFVIAGIEESALETGYALLIGSIDTLGGEEDLAAKQMEKKGLDGLVFLSGVASTTPILKVNPVSVPLVSVNCPMVPGCPSVMTDNALSGAQAAEHLLCSGATRPAVIAGPPERASANSRLRGFSDYLREQNTALPPERVVVSSYTSTGGHDALRRLLEQDPGIDGIFCHNDDIAAGALNYAAAAGIRVPEQLRVVGFDDKEYAAFWPTPITSFRPPLRKMGYIAGEILSRLIRDKKVDETQVLVKSELLIRTSSSPGAAAVTASTRKMA